MGKPWIIRWLLFLLLGNIAAAVDVTVATDGSGNYRTIQAAIDAIPANNRERVTVHVKNGEYREQVRIEKSFVTIRGEDRKLTKLIATVDTSACPTTPEQSKEEHCATLAANGDDLVFENLSVVNDFKGESGKGAALSVAGDSTRTVLSNVDVIGYGGDTLVLSARRHRIGDGGEYYLNDVYLSGTYHIIVPRGAAYVVNSKFWCMGKVKNCLFAEGITRETDKLVIRRSVIDGPEPFGLGSYFRDAAWYFIEDTISDKLLPDGKIFRVPAKGYEMKWGEGRIYYAGNSTPVYPWLRDNLSQSPAKEMGRVTAEWVFPEWKPESTTPPKVEGTKINGAEVEVTFSESVTVEGVPLIRIRSRKIAEYESGSGSSVLIFRLDASPSQEQKIGAIFASGAGLHRRSVDLGSISPTRGSP